MEKKRELTLEEMAGVSGGVHDREESRRYWVDPITCPHCGSTFRSDEDRDAHIRKVHPDKVQ